ncbi:MAG: DUF896 domain-containing protein [Oscillospiraceae bacterium]|nr:DUF896 domain-containing protein [Oscillospiraceae bacterium]
MTNEQIARINELAKKAKTVGLTPEEETERQELRAAYIKTFRESLRGQLDNTVIVRPDGTKESLKKK